MPRRVYVYACVVHTCVFGGCGPQLQHPDAHLSHGPFYPLVLPRRDLCGEGSLLRKRNYSRNKRHTPYTTQDRVRRPRADVSTSSLVESKGAEHFNLTDGAFRGIMPHGTELLNSRRRGEEAGNCRLVVSRRIRCPIGVTSFVSDCNIPNMSVPYFSGIYMETPRTPGGGSVMYAVLTVYQAYARLDCVFCLHTTTILYIFEVCAANGIPVVERKASFIKTRCRNIFSCDCLVGRVQHSP